MPDEMPDSAQINAGSEMEEKINRFVAGINDLDDEIKQFAGTVNLLGVAHLYGLEKHDNETDDDFKKRLALRIAETDRVKSRDEHNSELCAFLKRHFLDRLCWWSVSNGGDDFYVEVREPTDPVNPCIEIKVYPCGNPADKITVTATI